VSVRWMVPDGIFYSVVAEETTFSIFDPLIAQGPEFTLCKKQR
jgi:hypothetical protein